MNQIVNVRDLHLVDVLWPCLYTAGLQIIFLTTLYMPSFEPKNKIHQSTKHQATDHLPYGTKFL